MKDFSNFSLTTVSFGEIHIWYSMSKLDLQHPTQRHSVWTVEDGTKFIESVIENFPFEPIYIVKNKEGYSIIDGKQRISTLLYFAGIMKKDELYQDKSKNKDNLVNHKFRLSFDELSLEFKNRFKINQEESELLDVDFLSAKIPNLLSILSSLSFPCYIAFENDKERGDEENVYDLFKRLNSSGVTIENGETILSIFFDKKLENNDINNKINEFEKAIYKNQQEKHLKRKKVWEIFAKIFFIDANRKLFLNSEKDSENLDEQVEDFVKSLKSDEAKNTLDILEILTGRINDLIENTGHGFFNKTGNLSSKPENFYIYSIIMKLLKDGDLNKDYYENLKNVADAIINKNNEFDIEETDKETGEIKKVPLISKFNREPKKVSLGLFLADLNLTNFKGQEDYGNIRDSIYSKYVKK